MVEDPGGEVMAMARIGGTPERLPSPVIQGHLHAAYHDVDATCRMKDRRLPLTGSRISQRQFQERGTPIGVDGPAAYPIC
jgi:hypothetical protein